MSFISVWFGSGCQGRVFHQPKQPSKTAGISVFIAPLAEREELCHALFIFPLLFLPCLHLFYISSPFVHRLLVCFPPGLVRMKNTAPKTRDVEQDVSLTWATQKSKSARSLWEDRVIPRAKTIGFLTEADLTSPQGADNYEDLSLFIITFVRTSVSVLLFGTLWLRFARVHRSGNVRNVLQLIFVILC